jgi:hypothetical protein
MEAIEPPILVTGPPRSGTSLTAGFLAASGVWTGECDGAHDGAPRGFFENRRIKHDIFEPYLFAMGYDLLGKREVPPVSNNRRIPALRERVHEVLESQGYKGGPWLFKGPMMALTHSAWIDAFPSARWVIVERDPAENAAACMRTPWMHGLSLPQWRQYVREYAKRCDIIAETERVFRVNPFGADDPHEELSRLADELDLTPASLEQFEGLYARG